MNTKYILLCAFIMALVTYIPRFVPLLFFRKKIKSRFLQSFLYYMPYAVLSALTFPAIFFATGNLTSGIVGTIIALLLAYFKLNMTLVALICVALSFVLSFIL